MIQPAVRVSPAPMHPVVAVANAPQTLWRILGDRDASDQILSAKYQGCMAESR